MMERLRDEKFDLALGEHFDVCFYAIAQRAGIPKHISVFSTFISGALGIPTLPSFVPGAFRNANRTHGGCLGIIDVPANMTYTERVQNFLTTAAAFFIGRSLFVDRLEAVIRKHLGPDFDAMVSSYHDHHVIRSYLTLNAFRRALPAARTSSSTAMSTWSSSGQSRTKSSM